MKKIIAPVIILSLLLSVIPFPTASSARTVYTISPASKPYKKAFMKSKRYKANTKQYFLLRSYLERLEKTGGGELVLKKGTYRVTATLYVPSNVTIRLKSGAVISNQISKSNSSIFQLIRPSRSGKKNTAKGYSGEKNINFIGEGSASINMNGRKGVSAIVAAHNKSVKITRILFQKGRTTPYVKLAATDLVRISECRFNNNVKAERTTIPAIYLATPDAKTKDFVYAWAKRDLTPNKRLTISGNTFSNLDCAIASGKYTNGKYHSSVSITNNKFTTVWTDAIRMLNWSNPVVEGNEFNRIGGVTGSECAVHGRGVRNPLIQGNSVINTPRLAQFMPGKNSGSGSTYPVTKNTLGTKSLQVLKTNVLSNVNETFVRVNTIYGDYVAGTTYVPTRDKSLVVAHRGAEKDAPENTIAAFDRAIADGVDRIELDVQMTKDYQLVLMHDSTLNRTTTGSGSVRNFTLEEIKRLDAGVKFNPRFAGEKVPTLNEVFQKYGNRVRYYIETRPVDNQLMTEYAVMQAVRDNKIELKNVVIQSRSLDSLRVMRIVNSDLKLALVIGGSHISKAEMSELKAWKISSVVRPSQHITVKELLWMKSNSISVYPYFQTNEISEVKRVIALGVEGVITKELATALQEARKY